MASIQSKKGRDHTDEIIEAAKGLVNGERRRITYHQWMSDRAGFGMGSRTEQEYEDYDLPLEAPGDNELNLEFEVLLPHPQLPEKSELNEKEPLLTELNSYPSELASQIQTVFQDELRSQVTDWYFVAAGPNTEGTDSAIFWANAGDIDEN